VLAVFAISIVLIVVDQVSKILVVQLISPENPIQIIPHVLEFTLVRNTGIAFGLFKNYSTLVHGIVFVGCVVLIITLFRYNTKSHLTMIASACMLGGAIGNLIDRVRVGAVIDFIDFQIWPVFNLADSFISIAAGLFIITVLKNPHS